MYLSPYNVAMEITAILHSIYTSKNDLLLLTTM